jgi:hypothetical protein
VGGVLARVGIEEIVGEGRLTVGLRRGNSPTQFLSHRAELEELGDSCLAVEPDHEWWHGELDIIGQHADELIDVASLPGVNVPLD